MQRVITSRPEPQIGVKHLDDNSIIGIVAKHQKEKGQLVKVRKNEYIFCRAGGNNDFYRKSVHETIEDILTAPYVLESFVFENKSEFIKWLAKD